MNDIQKLFDAISDANRRTRGDYHLTLGSLIERLKVIEKTKIVKFSTGENVGGEFSYRGYYSDLCFDTSDRQKTVGEFLMQADSALGKAYTGYKGGDFVMGEDTPLWKAEYGDCGEAIIEIVDGNDVILVCKFID